MKLKIYLVLCVLISFISAATVLFVPGLAGVIEQELLTFLSTNAR